MSLATGVHLVRSRWTPLPMPREAQSRVDSFGRKQNMPKTLTFGDRHGREIPDTLDEVGEWSDDDDDTYEFQDEPDINDLSYDDTDEEVNDAENNVPLNNLPGTGTDHVDSPSIHSSTSEFTDNHENTGVSDNPPLADTIASTGLEEHGEGRSGQTTGVVEDLEVSSQSIETTGVEQDVDPDETTGVEQDVDLDDSDYDSTEEAEYEKAKQLGIESAHDDDRPLPKCIRKKKADEIYEYYNAMFAGIDVSHVFSSYDDEHSNQMFSFLTDQMSAKAGLKEFGDKGAASIMQELEQLLYWKVIVGHKASSLTSSQWKAALQYLLFLKEKRCGKVKA